MNGCELPRIVFYNRLLECFELMERKVFEKTMQNEPEFELACLIETEKKNKKKHVNVVIQTMISFECFSFVRKLF